MAPLGMPLYFRNLLADQRIYLFASPRDLSSIYVIINLPNTFIPPFRPQTAPHCMVFNVYDTCTASSTLLEIEPCALLQQFPDIPHHKCLLEDSYCTTLHASPALADLSFPQITTTATLGHIYGPERGLQLPGGRSRQRPRREAPEGLGLAPSTLIHQAPLLSSAPKSGRILWVQSMHSSALIQKLKASVISTIR